MRSAARRYYEEALALAPADTRLLRLYADALGRQGALAEAAAVIAEIALRTRAPAAQWVMEPSGPVAAPPAAASPRLAESATPPPSPSAPAVAAIVDAAPQSVAGGARARLERLSLGEIALVTTAAPLWRTLRAAPSRVARAVSVAPPETLHASVPSTPPLTGPTTVRMVRLLNAARREGLAGRSAGQLHNAGWRRLAIGNAPRVRAASLILYPAGRGSEARALGNRLHIAALRVARRSDILVLLGRDSA
jgi:hypothetical protein